MIKPYEQIKNTKKLQEVSSRAQNWLNNDFANDHELDEYSLCSSKKDVTNESSSSTK